VAELQEGRTAERLAGILVAGILVAGTQEEPQEVEAA